MKGWKVFWLFELCFKMYMSLTLNKACITRLINLVSCLAVPSVKFSQSKYLTFNLWDSSVINFHNLSVNYIRNILFHLIPCFQTYSTLRETKDFNHILDSLKFMSVSVFFSHFFIYLVKLFLRSYESKININHVS